MTFVGDHRNRWIAGSTDERYCADPVSTLCCKRLHRDRLVVDLRDVTTTCRRIYNHNIDPQEGT